MLKIILCSKQQKDETHSIEAGRHDGENHFDHHGEFEGENPPCTLPFQFKKIEDNAVIRLTHIDADVFLCLMALIRWPMYHEFKRCLDFDWIVNIDLNGTGPAKRAYRNLELAFVNGIAATARNFGTPRCTGFPVDITGIVNNMLQLSILEIMATGFSTMAKAERDWNTIRKMYYFRESAHMIGVEYDPYERDLDPSMAYDCGYHFIMVYNWKTRAISLYANFAFPIVDLRRLWAGIPFDGHAHACGSPRGIEMSLAQAREVFDAIVAVANPAYGLK